MSVCRCGTRATSRPQQIQLLAPYQRAVVWRVLPTDVESARRDDQYDRQKLLQIPVLFEFGADGVHGCIAVLDIVGAARAKGAVFQSVCVVSDAVWATELAGWKLTYFSPPRTLWTNQYAVTEQNSEVPDSTVPGIFVKFDIEPILLTISEEWGGVLGLVIRLVNVVAGILVAGGWIVSLLDWAGEMIGRRRRRGMPGEGSLIGRPAEKQGLD